MMPEQEVSIPVVDIGKITSADPTCEDFQDVGEEMVRVLNECGFLYLKNHGVDQNTLDGLDSVATSFFNLDEKVKNKYNKTAMGGYNGNEAEYYRESFDYNQYEPSHAAFRNVAEVPSLNAVVSQFYEEMKKLTKTVMTALERGLGLPENALLDLHKSLMADGANSSTTCRMLLYPGIDDDTEVPEGSLRCGAHSDYGTFTFVFQDDIGGLEILNKKNVWQSAKPMEGVAIFNLGDLLETLTAGRLTAMKHRVVIPKNKEHRKLDRRSYVYFVVPDNDVTVRPFFPCPEGKYPALNSFDHINRRLYSTNQPAD